MLCASQVPGIATTQVARSIDDIGDSRLAGILWTTVLAVLLASVSLPAAWAQVSANLSGVITDPSGAAVPDASVTAENLDTGSTRTAPTDQAGRYRFFALSVGTYEVRVTKDGFAEGIRSGIRLVVGQDAKADLSLWDR